MGVEDERRRFSRIAFHRAADLDVGGSVRSCQVLDVSLRGALLDLQADACPEAGQPCSLVIHLDAGDAAIRMHGEISHREGTLVGVRCTGIDLESIAHLRRIVELNLGDDDALHRELAALVSPRR